MTPGALDAIPSRRYGIASLYILSVVFIMNPRWTIAKPSDASAARTYMQRYIPKLL